MTVSEMLRWWTYHIFPAVVLISSACYDEDYGCKDAEREFLAGYIGSVGGRGRVAITKSKEGPLQLNLSLIGPEKDGKTEEVMSLSGIGYCKKGLVAATLGASEQENGEFKVLGGTMTAVVSRELTSYAFGTWTADVVETQTGGKHSFDGFWKELSMPKPFANSDHSKH